MANFTVLIVEDNEINAIVLREILEENTFEVLNSVTAEDGISMARLHHPDLIFMDIQLPGMDGFEALRHLQEDPLTKEIAVVAVTATTRFDRSTYLKAGFEELIAKPVTVTKVIKCVRNFVLY